MTEAKPPALHMLIREAGALVMMQALARFGSEISVPVAAEPRLTMVIPGFMASDSSTARMRRSLVTSGQPAFGWAQGRNWGITEDILERIDARVTAIQGETGLHNPVNLVGWSLGGLIAREYSKFAPNRVAKVITLGSPFSGNIRANNAWRAYEFIAGHKVDETPISANLKEKPPVPTFAFWSHQDGIVSPNSARGKNDESDVRIEMDCTHMAFVSKPSAISAVADALYLD